MGYEGRDILIMNCNEILQDLRQEYLKEAKILIKQSDKYIDIYELEDTLNLIFDSLLQKSYDRDIILHNIHKSFGGEQDFAKYVIVYCLFHILHSFSSIILSKYPNLVNCIIYLENAIEYLHKIFLKAENLNNDLIKTTESQKVNFGGTGSIFFANAIDELKKAYLANKKLTFLNLYNGVNIECLGEIVSISEEGVLCRVELTQILAMKEEGNAYISKKDVLTGDIKSDVLSIDLIKNTVLLNNFVRMKNMFASQRKYPRVYPNKFTKVILKNSSGISIQGKLYDISQGGIGIVSLEDGGFKHGEELTANFNLLIDNEEVDVNLEINLVVALKYQGSMRYCCQITKKQAITEKIIQFSKIRVMETLNDLKQKVELYR